MEQVLALPEGTRFTVDAPVVRGRKGEFKELFEQLRADGYTRIRVDGEQRLLEDPIDARQADPAHDRGGRRPAGHEGGACARA